MVVSGRARVSRPPRPARTSEESALDTVLSSHRDRAPGAELRGAPARRFSRNRASGFRCAVGAVEKSASHLTPHRRHAAAPGLSHRDGPLEALSVRLGDVNRLDEKRVVVELDRGSWPGWRGASGNIGNRFVRRHG